MEENTLDQPQEIISNYEVDTVKEKNNSNKGLMICAVILAVIAIVLALIAILKTPSSDSNTTKPATAKTVQDGNLKIAYINTDTIMAKYEYALEMQKELQDKQSQMENSLKQKYINLQNEFENYKKTGYNLTRAQQDAKEKEFDQRGQQLSQAMQQQPAQFQQEVAQQNEKLLNAVLAFVKDYNSKHDKFNVIFSVSHYNGPTLYIDEGMDITNEIVEGLNEEHRKLKNSK